MKSTTIIAIILGVLVFVSAVQAFQLNGLKEKVAEAGLSIGSSTTGVPTASTGDERTTAALPASIKDLPQMVGGC